MYVCIYTHYVYVYIHISICIYIYIYTQPLGRLVGDLERAGEEAHLGWRGIVYMYVYVYIYIYTLHIYIYI